MTLVGKSIPRKEGRKKVTGQALYVDDLKFEGMLHGVTVRSSIARGRIKSISFDQPPASSTPLGMPSRGPRSAGGSDRNIPWDEFTIVTTKDIPGENYVALILNDQPYLAENSVNHPEEPIVLLAHHDKYLLEEARRHVSIEYEELPAIFSLEESLAQKEIIWGEDNVFKKFLVDKGNVDDVWSSADFIVEGEYETGAQEQLYIEPNGAIAIANPSEGVTVWGSMQCPYYVHKALIKLFGLP
ncbi:MAG TPA: molybdopterin cofactor-binding domain-containing protein, partial [Pyrinomonadaceae bacterium]|nr:molybdopterin cofactor-binding domain-containing protein [Pyrinomonadaceae bacterium]